MLGVSLNAGFDHRRGEAVTENTYAEGEGRALHTGVLPAPGSIVLDWELWAGRRLFPQVT
jgi:hypothetical protein